MGRIVKCSLLLDLPLLRQQKTTLLNLSSREDKLSSRDIDAINGIIGVLDCIQDQAVDTNGIPEKEVFGKGGDL